MKHHEQAPCAMHCIAIIVAAAAFSDTVFSQTVVLEAMPPPIEVLTSPDGVAVLIAQHTAYLESGTLAADLAASRAAGSPGTHWLSWASAFRTALASGADAPQRRTALVLLAGYLSALEEWEELCAVHLESASLEPLASDAMWHRMLALGAKSHAVGPGSGAEAVCELIDLAGATIDAHQEAVYSSPALRSNLAWRLLGNSRFAAEQVLRVHTSVVNDVQVARMSSIVERAVDVAQSDCTDADRVRIRQLHAHLDAPLLIAAEMAAMTGDVASLERRVHAIRSLSAADRGIANELVAARVVSRVRTSDVTAMRPAIADLLSALPPTVSSMQIWIQAIREDLVPEAMKNPMLEQAASWLASVSGSDSQVEFARDLRSDAAALLAARLSTAGETAEAEYWRSVAESARASTIVPAPE